MAVVQIIKNLIDDTPDRQRNILVGRFGLSKEGRVRTLAYLGEDYGITRERVRQIESAALDSLSQKIKKQKEVLNIIEKTIDHLRSVGGLKREDYFINDLKFLFGDENLTANHVRFLFSVSGSPYFYNDDDHYYDFWYIDDSTLDRVNNFVSRAHKFFSDKKEHLIFQNKFSHLLEELASEHNLCEFVALNYLIISKKFSVNPYNDFGLSHWEEINPKTIRSKAYLVLKKHAQPLHFRELSDLINQITDSKKKAYAQTVHNELIKDPRVVLVGRGIYALKEHGYVPGTCKEIIAKILREHGPLTKEKILSHLSRQRILKPNTILLNLQNKKHFQRTVDGRYRLAGFKS